MAQKCGHEPWTMALKAIQALILQQVCAYAQARELVEQVTAYARQDPEHRKILLQMGLVIGGFIYPALGPVRSIRDIQDRIAELARAKPPGEWIVTMPIGDPPYYFDVPDILAEKRWPTRQELDAAAPDHPVYIRPIWGFWRHSLPLVSIANTAMNQTGQSIEGVAIIMAVFLTISLSISAFMNWYNRRAALRGLAT